MLVELFRHAVRRLVREPAFSAAAVTTLSLGVGASVAVFAVFEAVLLRPLPYSRADQLAILNHRDERTGITKEFIAIGDYVDLVRRQSVFETLSAYGEVQGTIVDGGDPIRVSALQAAPGLLEVLRVRPVVGRDLRPEDSRPGAQLVMLLGYETWKNQFGSDPDVIGRTITYGQELREIVGVAPPGFAFPPSARSDVVVPLTVPFEAPSERKSAWTFAVGRLKAGRTVEDAAAELRLVSRQLETEYPRDNQASTYFPLPIRTAFVGDARSAVVLLFAAVAVVLLIACANVANLLLARALGRRQEMSVRLALGAGRARLAMQLLSESLVLAVTAGVVGIVLAQFGSQLLVSLLPQATRLPGLDVRINGTVLAFALAVVLLTALAFSIVALLTVRSEHGSGVLNATRGASMSRGARRAATTIVGAEVALSVMLLVGAGLILRSFAQLLSVNPGFRMENVMTIEMRLPAGRYAVPASREGFYQRVLAEVKALPSVQEAGAAIVVPLTGNNWSTPFQRADQPIPAGERPPEVGFQSASNGYFRSLEIPLLSGRYFDERDRASGAPVAIVSEAIERRFFPQGSAVGQQIIIQDGQRFEIVGVVGNIRRAGLRDEPRADLYFPFERTVPLSTTLFVRTTGEPTRALPELRAAIARIEPGVTLQRARALADIAGESERVTRALLWLLGVFAGTSLALAAIGIYSIMSYAVRHRAREIGTRIALGATRRQIVWLVMRQGALIAAIGSVVGLVMGQATTRYLSSILFGVSGNDPWTLTSAVALLAGTIMLACYLPARRAASVDPARTLADR